MLTSEPRTYVGFPNIAQGDVNDATLTIDNQVVSNPTKDSIHLKIDSVSHSDSMFHPELDSFRASLSYCKSDDPASAQPPFGHITIPSSIAGEDVPITVEQDMKITNMDEFIKYNIAVLTEEKFHILVSGDLDLHEGSLPTTTVDYDKVVTMKGLNGLKGFEIRNTKINAKAGVKKNVKGEVFIPNPSVLTIEMGTVTMDLSVDGKPIGYSVIEDLTLKPGDNTFDMWGHSNIGAVMPLLSKYKDLIIPVDISGNKSVSNGVEIPYFSAAVQANPLSTKLDLNKALG